MSVEKLEKILKQVAHVENLKNYEVFPNLDSIKGEGFLSESYTGEVVDKNTGVKIHTYVKIPPMFELLDISSVYNNENHFYKKIFPELDKFQRSKGVKSPFDNIPKFFCGSDKPEEQYVALENLKIQNYNLYDKSQFINEKLLKQLFQLYGKFHALSFAFKDQHIEEYLELVAPIKVSLTNFRDATKVGFIQAYNNIKSMDEEMAKKIEPYTKKLEEIYFSALVYDGKYSTLTHGDCWSNNMLFKYKEEGTVEDIKFIDFQLCRDSTPIHDLSYFFYSAASKEDFDKLEEYLELYYKSFSAFAKELGSDPEKLLPFSVLKSEWKKYGLFGILVGILLWQGKLMDKDTLDLITAGKSREKLQQMQQLILASDTYKKNTTDILMHAVEYGIFK